MNIIYIKYDVQFTQLVNNITICLRVGRQLLTFKAFIGNNVCFGRVPLFYEISGYDSWSLRISYTPKYDSQ